MRTSSIIFAGGIAALAMAPQAEARTCSEGIAALARQYALSTELPQAEPPSGTAERPATEESRGMPPESLSRSGGVIAPPQEGSGRVITPPRTGGDAMPTAPPVPPQTSQAPSTGSTEISAAKRAQMQSLLESARAAESRGDEAGCLDRLEKARAVPGAR